MDAYLKELARKVKRLKPDQSLVRRNNARKRVKKAVQALLRAMDREFPRISVRVDRSGPRPAHVKLRSLIKNGFIFPAGITVQQTAKFAEASVPVRYLGESVMVKDWAWVLKDQPLHELKKAVKSPNHRKILLATQALAKAGPA